MGGLHTLRDGTELRHVHLDCALIVFFAPVVVGEADDRVPAVDVLGKRALKEADSL